MKVGGEEGTQERWNGMDGWVEGSKRNSHVEICSGTVIRVNMSSLQTK